MRFTIAAVLSLALTVPALAKDHASDYQVGVFTATSQASDGNMTSCSGRNCRSFNQAHNIHTVQTTDGFYTIEAPISVGASILVAMATDGVGGEIHKQWFMDQLHEGDKVLLASKCNKHNNCVIWLPNPDKVGKEIQTLGYYSPNNAKTNTQNLCGKGKLKREVEAQVCPVQTAQQTPAPIAPPPVVKEDPVAAPVPAPKQQ